MDDSYRGGALALCCTRLSLFFSFLSPPPPTFAASWQVATGTTGSVSASKHQRTSEIRFLCKPLPHSGDNYCNWVLLGAGTCGRNLVHHLSKLWKYHF